MKAILYTILTNILSYILGLVPKSKDILVFRSFPDLTDNSFAVYNYLNIHRKDQYRLIWIFSNRESHKKHPEVESYYRFCLKAFYYFARAKYVFCTHGLYSFLDLNQGSKIVNMWHGMPLKTIGCLDPKYKGGNPTKADYLVATSPTFQKLMSKAFNNQDLNNVLVIGQPRNDLLFEETDFFINRGVDKNKYVAVGIWLPTYRKSSEGDIRADGVYNENGISFLSMAELTALGTFLKRNNVLLIVKLHPMDILQHAHFDAIDNMIILKQSDLKEQLYPLLGSCDFLLTDYSSVWIDYCILKKPIGYVMNDIEEYKESRGLVFTELDKKLPGVIIDNYVDLCNFIKERPNFNPKKIDIFNSYCDNKSTERLINYLSL